MSLWIGLLIAVVVVGGAVVFGGALVVVEVLVTALVVLVEELQPPRTSTVMTIIEINTIIRPDNLGIFLSLYIIAEKLFSLPYARNCFPNTFAGLILAINVMLRPKLRTQDARILPDNR